MSNSAKVVVSIVGMAVGLAIMIVGFTLLDTSNYAIGEPIQFGADFYTEMYAVTKDVGRAINHAVNDLIRAVAWLIVSLGAVAMCGFAYKLVKHCDLAGLIPVIKHAFGIRPAPVAESDPEDVTESVPDFEPAMPETPAVVFAETAGTPQSIDTENYWICGTCKKTNLHSNTACWSCGTAKG